MKIFALTCCVLCSGCATGNRDRNPAATVAIDDGKMQYLDEVSIDAVVQKAHKLTYPLERTEVLNRLGLAGRLLPSLTSNGRSLWRASERISSWHEQIGLTAFGANGRKARVLLWFPSPDSRSVIYAEILREGDTSRDSSVQAVAGK
jgi:hypothetical protein